MRKPTALVLLVIVSSFAGCGFFGGNTTPTSGTATASPGSETDITASVEAIVPKESQLPEPYTQMHEGRTLRNESNDTSMKENGMVMTYTRVFSTDDETLPETVYSSATLFDNSSAADTWLTGHLNESRTEHDATVEHQTISGDIAVTVTSAEHDGRRGVSIYRKNREYVYTIGVSGGDSPLSVGKEWFLKMVEAAEG